MSRLFHTLVVCGAGLTLGCSADSNDDEPPSPSSGGSAGAAGSSGQAGTGFNLGGLINGIGGSPPALGGSGGRKDEPGPLLPNAEGQWVCTDEITGCATGRHEGQEEAWGFALSAACPADLDRPKTVDECASDQKLVCALGFFMEQAVLFDCRCLQVGAADCTCPMTGDGCTKAVGAYLCEDERTVCGCAITCIAK